MGRKESNQTNKQIIGVQCGQENLNLVAVGNEACVANLTLATSLV